jgi:outer membrane receptor protein involved in Fe transport
VNYRGVRDPVLYNDRGYGPDNTAPYSALQMPLERLSAWLKGHYMLTDQVELYAQALYGGYSVERELDAAVIGVALIPPTNPFVPADLATLLLSRDPESLDKPDAPYRYFRRAREVGPQTATNDRDVLQVTTGLRTRFGPDWKLDLYAQFGQNHRTERQTNNVSLSRVQDLTFAPDGGLSICDGGFNPYVAGSLSPDCARYIAVDASSTIRLRQMVAEATVDGSLASLPAGALQVAGGVFYKRDEFEYDADAALSAMLPAVPDVFGPRPDIAGFGAAPDRSGNEGNIDGYIELRAPLIANARGGPALEAGLGYRYSDYTQAGGVSSYKAELVWDPLQSLRLRGSYQHAVRAPSIEELYYPQLRDQFFIPLPEPCSVRSSARHGPDAAKIESLCVAQGVPADLIAGYDFQLRRVDGVSGGNPKLKPEEADTWTAGFVWTRPISSAESRFRDIQLSLDWYQVQIEDGIGRWDAESAVKRCFDPAYNPTYSNANVYCTFFSRDAITGNIIAEIIDRNIGGLETAGVDAQLEWGLDAGPGSLDMHALATYVDHWTYRDPGGGAIEYSGTVGGGALGRSLPRWKSLFEASYGLGSSTLLLRWQHMDSMHDINVRDFEIPAYDYVDLGASHAFDEGAFQGLTVHAGVDNVFDRQPPIFPTWQQANTDPSAFDVLGRRFYVRLQYRFR